MSKTRRVIELEKSRLGRRLEREGRELPNFVLSFNSSVSVKTICSDRVREGNVTKETKTLF